METKIHSQTTMEWPAKKKQELENLQAQKAKAAGTDHFPIKDKADLQRYAQTQAQAQTSARPIPGAPIGPSGAMPTARPVEQVRAPVQAPDGKARPTMPPRPVSPSLPARTPLPQTASVEVPQFTDADAQAFQQFLDQGAQVQAPMARPPFEQSMVSQLVEQVIQPKALQVENVMPGFTAPTADAEYTSVALPSRFAYYGFKDLYVKPFIITHIGKLQRAHNEKSLLPIIEAMSTVLYTTDERYQGVPLAFELSLPDFFFVLYWLRLNSFTKSNYVHTTMCQNQEHIDKVEAGTLAADTLKISEVIRRTDMKINELETIPDPELYQLSDPRLVTRPPVMRDVIEMAEDPRMRSADTRHEFGFYARLASHFQHSELYMTLGQRVDLIKEGDLDDMSVLMEFEKAINGYGVEEKIRVQCKCCGAYRDSKLVIAAHSFFR